MTQLLAFAAAAISVTLLTWWYRRLRAGDRMAVILTRKRGTSMLTSSAQLIDGANHIPVALSLDAGRFSYESEDFDASIDVQQIDEVEYGSDLVTGGIADGAVLRVRSHGRAFEFVVDVATAERWCQHLPPHRFGQTGRVEVV